MALHITPLCFSCYACETVCPEKAITNGADVFVINPTLCNECNDISSPRCIAICPEPDAIQHRGKVA
ncbi:MAG: 4Fe-4S binding protein [Psychromonas sp.]